MMHHRLKALIAMLAIAMMVAAAPGRAQIVTNGGFEAGFTGWNLNPNDCGTFDGLPYDGPAYTGPNGTSGGSSPHTGALDIWMGASGCTPSFSQTLPTLFGHNYTLSFWEQVTSAYPTNEPNMFGVAIGSDTLFQGQITNNPWEEMSFNFTAAGGDQLTFFGNNINGANELDDVNVNPQGAVTPEPGTMTMLGVGLVGLGAVGGRRRPKRAAA